MPTLPGLLLDWIRRAVSSAASARNGAPGSRPRSAAGSPPSSSGLRNTVRYDPHPDGQPDPGEVVWTWVPYEEDPLQGKDRPVLLVGRSGGSLLGLMLTSKDHADDHRGDNDYLFLGPGPWDRSGRPSDVKLDRILRIDPVTVRREGAVLDAKRFAPVADALRSRHGWQ